MTELAVTLFAHAREHTLGRVFAQLATLRRLFGARIVAGLDRPTAAVERRVTEFLEPADVLVKFVEPVIGETENFPVRQNELQPFVNALQPRWVLWQPDDLVLEPGWEPDFATALAAEDVDVWFFRSLFYWDAERIRLDVFPVCDPLLWRWRPSARFDERRQLLAPPAIVDEARRRGRVRIFPRRNLDFGFSTPEDRDRCWRRALRTGKIDDYTRALVTEPRLLVSYEDVRERLDVPPGTCH